jgi:hypothetical protein
MFGIGERYQARSLFLGGAQSDGSLGVFASEEWSLLSLVLGNFREEDSGEKAVNRRNDVAEGMRQLLKKPF